MNAALPHKQWAGVGSAMAESLKRVNTPRNLVEAMTTIDERDETIAGLEAQIIRLKQELRETRERNLNLPMGKSKRHDFLTPSSFARAHNVSVATVIRACNSTLGYKLEGEKESRVVGYRKDGSPVVRWYIDPGASIHHTPKSRKKSEQKG